MKNLGTELRSIIKQVIEKEFLGEANCSGNKRHKKNGQWGSSKDDGSWSIKDRSGCEKGGQHKMTNGEKKKSNKPCGRVNRKQLCKEEDEAEPVSQIYNRERLELMIRDTIKKELEILRKDKGGCSWKQILNAMNTVDLARDGNLHKKSN
tara:strand:+ start:647 stop:1096 length:450 start_codon:yes stop_codon:yes gene_type:complete